MAVSFRTLFSPNRPLCFNSIGAGSIMESLELNKPLIVVINDQLMHNHQTELARQLQSDSHLLYTTCGLVVLMVAQFYAPPANTSHLVATLEQMDPVLRKPYTRGNPEVFGHYLDSVMGFR